MNIYADRGNLLLLERRCAWRGIGFERHRAPASATRSTPTPTTSSTSAAARTATSALCAAGPRRDQARRPARRRRRGRVVLGVCGGYQLLGHSYELGDERDPRASGWSTCDTVREEGPRLIGNVAIEVDCSASARTRVLAGFENHGGRTHLGAGEQPLGRVLARPRQQRARGLRGRPARHGHRHLPARPAAAQERLVRRLADRHRARRRATLAPLDDALEDAAHRSARRAAGLD